MYGKINEKGRLEIYDKPYIINDGTLIANPSKEKMAAIGYKPLICGKAPEVGDGEILSITYEEKSEHIEAVYTVLGG